jgi:chaperonin GroES
VLIILKGVIQKHLKILKEEYDMKLVPLGDKVVLKQLVAEETTKSGIVLPGQAKEKPQQAQVIAVGLGGIVDGKEIVMQVKPGDKVIYSKYAGTEVKLDDVEFIIVKQNDIVAVVED